MKEKKTYIHTPIVVCLPVELDVSMLPLFLSAYKKKEHITRKKKEQKFLYKMGRTI